MHKKSLSIILLLSSLTAATTSLAESFEMQHLQTLFNGYQRQQAYDYASRYLAEMEGDGAFDYLYGVSAIDAGHASQGVFALERVLLLFPDDHLARLELARGYFILEEYARSRQEFEKVLTVNPPKGVRDTTESFLEQIRLKEARYRTTTGGSVALGLGSDSNVNSSTDDSNPYGDDIPPFALTTTSLQQSDTYTELAANWGIGHPFAPGWMITGNLTAALRQNQDWDVFDTTSATLQTGISRIDKDSRYKSELLYQKSTVDGFEESDRNLSGINFDWQYSLSQKTKLNTGLQYAVLAYPKDASKDSALVTLSYTYTQNVSVMWNPVFFANVNLGQETPADAASTQAYLHDRDILGLRLGSILSFSPRLALQISAGMQTSDYPVATYYDLNASPFDEKRKDTFTSANINLLWLINKDWRLDTRLGYNNNDSNINIYRYDRSTIGLEANYSF